MRGRRVAASLEAMITFRKTMMGAALAATAVATAACGSSSDKGGDALSRSAIVAKANAICTKAETDAKAVQAPASYRDATVAARYFDQIAPITDTETRALVALKPADDVRDDYAAFTRAQTDANTLLQSIRHKADTRDASGMDDLNRVAPAGDRVSAAATKLGAKTCG
jgi:hypothetical protein